jgi:hypothetical protein
VVSPVAVSSAGNPAGIPACQVGQALSPVKASEARQAFLGRPKGLPYQAASIFVATAAIVYAQVYASNLPSETYLKVTADDPVARLVKQDAHPEDLSALLARLNINPDSQALVFSKTSFQAGKISPRNPRAIYFNDDAAVGWVRGSSSMEVAAIDPKNGVMFYTLDNGRFERQQVCLRCHQGAATMGVPGIFVGSVFPDISGMPDRSGAIITDHRTKFSDRWGGWYVNAIRGEPPDRANGVADDPSDPHSLRSRQNVTSLARDFNPAGYLSPVSDIVALMTFEHQTQMSNLMTRVAWLARMGEPLDSDIEALVRYMTFADEAPLQERIEGVSSFTKTFPQRGPRDNKGRSLRDFDLETRLFRYPLSYMVYSAQFAALPAEIRARIWQRVRAELKGRADVLEILRDTVAPAVSAAGKVGI